MLTDYQRYLIVGPRSSGKSVLLASLLDWLCKEPGKIFPEGNSWTATCTQPCKGGLPPFPLQRILGEMANQGDWPNPTYDPSGIRFEAIRGGRFRRLKHRIERDFVDFPGERFADFLGIDVNRAHRSFESWSSQILECFPRHADGQSIAAIREYEELLRSSTPISCTRIVEAYHCILREASERHRYLISPSSIVSRINLQDFEPAKFPDAFAPLPESFGPMHEATRRQFREEFARYQRQVVDPLRRLIRQADAIVITVDVSWILSGGIALFHDQRTLVNAFGNYLRHMEQWWKRLNAAILRPVIRHAPARLRKIVICGTKLDIFAPADASRLEDLIKTFTAEVRNSAGHAGVKVDYVACSAARASTSDETDSTMLHGFIDSEKATVSPSRLPKQWPDAWDPAQYRFPIEFDPRIRKSLLYPPNHQNLDTLFRSLEAK